MNILLGLALIFFSFTALLAAYRFFGKAGLFAWVGLASALANIQVEKTVDIFGITATLGNTLYGSIFLATDMLNEYWGQTAAKRSVWLGFGAIAVMIATMTLAICFVPAESDTASEHLAAIFKPSLRIAAASIAAYLASQFLDVRLFQSIKQKLPADKYLWVRNNVSTCVSQTLDTAIFVTAAFAGTYDGKVLLEIYVTTYLFKAAVAVMDTPFMYFSKRIKPADI